MSIKQTITKTALTTAMNYISGDPEKNLPKLLSFIESIGWGKEQTDVFHKILDDPENVWYEYLMNLWHDIDNDVLKATFRNFGLNASLFGYAEQKKNEEKYSCNIPWAILLDPTSACNLHCTGCWAAEYGNKLNLTYEEMDSIVNQANRGRNNSPVQIQKNQADFYDGLLERWRIRRRLYCRWTALLTYQCQRRYGSLRFYPLL